MENVLVENSSLNEYFKIEYNNQNLNDNPLYLKWKDSMIILKGNDAKFIKCEKDNIIFACTKKSFKGCKSTCPICNKEICYYCSIYLSDPCCIKSNISYFLFQKIFNFIFDIREENDDPLDSPI